MQPWKNGVGSKIERKLRGYGDHVVYLNNWGVRSAIDKKLKAGCQSNVNDLQLWVVAVARPTVCSCNGCN